MQETKSKATRNEEKPQIVKKTSDLQRLRLEKLMKNPDKPVVIPDRPKTKNMPSAPDFVRNVMGSSAGAGSGEFHVYRHLRRKEYARQKFIQEKSEKEILDEDYHKKIEQNRQATQEKTAKKRAKRLKKKLKAKQRGKKPKVVSKNESDSESESSENEEDNDTIKIEEDTIVKKDDVFTETQTDNNGDVKTKLETKVDIENKISKETRDTDGDTKNNSSKHNICKEPITEEEESKHSANSD